MCEKDDTLYSDWNAIIADALSYLLVCDIDKDAIKDIVRTRKPELGIVTWVFRYHNKRMKLNRIFVDDEAGKISFRYWLG